MTNPPSAYLLDAVAPDDLYAGKPPSDISRPQPALLALASAGAISGRVLDAGGGTGEHVLTDPDGLPAWLVVLTRI